MDVVELQDLVGCMDAALRDATIPRDSLLGSLTTRRSQPALKQDDVEV